MTVKRKEGVLQRQKLRDRHAGKESEWTRKMQ